MDTTSQVPKKVKQAVYIIVARVVITIVNIILRKLTMVPIPGRKINTSAFIIVAVLLLAFELFIVYKIYNRKNWARIVFFILVLLATFAVFFQKDKGLPILHDLSIMEFMLAIVAVILLLSKESATWFSDRTRKMEEMVAEIGT